MFLRINKILEKTSFFKRIFYFQSSGKPPILTKPPNADPEFSNIKREKKSFTNKDKDYKDKKNEQNKKINPPSFEKKEKKIFELKKREQIQTTQILKPSAENEKNKNKLKKSENNLSEKDYKYNFSDSLNSLGIKLNTTNTTNTTTISTEITNQSLSNYASVLSKFNTLFKEIPKDSESKLLKEYIPQRESDSTSNDLKETPSFSFFKNVTTKIDESKNRSAYQIENYLKGEEGIDYIHLPADSTAFFDAELNSVKEQFEFCLNRFSNSNHFEEAKEKISWRHDQLMRSHLDDFTEENFKIYPGNQKGESAEEDPQHFVDWYMRNAPKVLVTDVIETSKNLTNKYENKPAATLLGATEILGTIEESNLEIMLDDPEAEIMLGEDHHLYRSSLDEDGLEPYPDQECMIWDDNMFHVQKWNFFKMFPKFMGLMDFLSNVQNDLNNIKQEKEIVLPSLLRYYNTLPKFARDNHLVKKVVRAFEFTKHELTLEQKEIAVNYICQFTLPLDPLTVKAMKQAYISTKYYYEEDDLEDILPGDEEKEEENKDEAIRAEAKFRKKMKEKENKEKGIETTEEIQSEILIEEEEDQDDENWGKKKYKPKTEEERKELLEMEEAMKDPNFDACFYYDIQPTPPKIKWNVPLETQGPNFDLEYYDNDDGFWNDYIKKKEKNYDSYPMIYQRPFFKH